jgi:hypothetical protein
MTQSVVIPQLFPPALLTGSAATYYTNPGPTNTILVNASVRFTNNDTATRQVTAYAVPFGGSAGASNRFMNAESIPPNAHVDIIVPALADGDFLEAFADTASKVTILSLSGTLITP